MAEDLGDVAETGADAAYTPDVARLKRRYLDYVETKRAERDEARESEHYYHADQYTSSDRAVLAERKQPAVTYNRIARKIDGVVGAASRNAIRAMQVKYGLPADGYPSAELLGRLRADR